MSADRPTAFRRFLGRAGSTRLLSNLRARLLLLVLLAVLPALGLIVYNAIEQRQIGTEVAQMEAKRLVRTASSMNEHMLDGARQLLITLSQLDAVRHRNSQACAVLFSNLMRLQPVYANIGGIDLDGTVFASAVPMANQINVADRAYFQDATNRLDISVGSYQVGRITGKSSVNIGYPIFDRYDQDPAVASSIFVTMITDSMGFFAFLGLATAAGLSG